MTTKKNAAPAQELAGEGRMNAAAEISQPVGFDTPMTKAELRVALAGQDYSEDAIDEIVSLHENGDVPPGHLFGLTAAAPGGIVLAKKQSVLDWIFGNTALTATADTNYYVGLVTGTYTGGTSDIAILQGTFTGTPEVVTTAWTNYAVATVANAAAQWTAASGVAGTQVATKTNTNAISFTSNATVSGTGPTPTGWFIANSATLRAAANIIATGNLTGGSVAVVNGASVSFAAAALSITLT